MSSNQDEIRRPPHPLLGLSGRFPLLCSVSDCGYMNGGDLEESFGTVDAYGRGSSLVMPSQAPLTLITHLCTSSAHQCTAHNLSGRSNWRGNGL